MYWYIQIRFYNTKNYDYFYTILKFYNRRNIFVTRNIDQYNTFYVFISHGVVYKIPVVSSTRYKCIVYLSCSFVVLNYSMARVSKSQEFPLLWLICLVLSRVKSLCILVYTHAIMLLNFYALTFSFFFDTMIIVIFWNNIKLCKHIIRSA